MKHRLLALGIIGLAMVALGTSPAGAASAAGPYYAIPSWDQKLQCDAPATCPRFIVLSNWGNAAVLDRETGLVWQQSPGDTDGDGDIDANDRRTWLAAQSRCNNLNVGNRKGWRLPTVQELASLLDLSMPPGSALLPAGHPFSNVPSAFYWSATTFADFTSRAWGVQFSDGVVEDADKSSDHFVWCVRGGQGVDPQ